MQKKKLIICAIIFAITFTIVGYSIGQVPMSGNKASQLERMHNSIDEGFYENWQSMGVLMMKVPEVTVVHCDIGIGYLLSFEDKIYPAANIPIAAHNLNFTDEETLVFYEFFAIVRLLAIDAYNLEDKNEEEYTKLRNILYDLKMTLYRDENNSPVRTYEKFFKLYNSEKGQESLDVARKHCHENHPEYSQHYIIKQKWISS